MNHTIPLTTLPRGAAMAGAVDQCVHCGFCLAACPTYAVLGQEMDSPRGRIVLMKEVLEGNLDAAEAQPHIDRCLGCLACMPACPSGVRYGDLVTSYRAHVERGRRRPPVEGLARRLIVETLPYPKRFRLAARGGRLARLAAGALPARLQAMVGLLPAALPPAEPLPAVVPAEGERRARVALLTGCVQQVLAPRINWATLAVLAANGVETVIPREQGCCGALMMHIGEERRALALARNNLACFPADVDAVITNAAGCGSGMHEYPLLFAGQPEADQAGAFARRVKDITTFLDELGLRPFPEGQPARRVAYQDACHLLHAQGIGAAPRRLLRAVPNLTLLELNDGGLCCGSAGTYNLEQPEIAAELGRRKSGRILATSADLVVSGNIGCQTQIESHLRTQGSPLPVHHTIELLATAYQLP